ncbi:MAG: hypothetical protein V4608_06845 [Bacteroidota bacterium]
MVEIFKTDIADTANADLIVGHLMKFFPSAKINVDVEDCDKVLRIEDNSISITEVIQLTKDVGCVCEVIM